jgi:hypothetical protein
MTTEGAVEAKFRLRQLSRETKRFVHQDKPAPEPHGKPRRVAYIFPVYPSIMRALCAKGLWQEWTGDEDFIEDDSDDADDEAIEYKLDASEEDAVDRDEEEEDERDERRLARSLQRKQHRKEVVDKARTEVKKAKQLQQATLQLYGMTTAAPPPPSATIPDATDKQVVALSSDASDVDDEQIQRDDRLVDDPFYQPFAPLVTLPEPLPVPPQGEKLMQPSLPAATPLEGDGGGKKRSLDMAFSHVKSKAKKRARRSMSASEDLDDDDEEEEDEDEDDDDDDDDDDDEEKKRAFEQEVTFEDSVIAYVKYWDDDRDVPVYNLIKHALDVFKTSGYLRMDLFVAALLYLGGVVDSCFTTGTFGVPTLPSLTHRPLVEFELVRHGLTKLRPKYKFYDIRCSPRFIAT